MKTHKIFHIANWEDKHWEEVGGYISESKVRLITLGLLARFQSKGRITYGYSINTSHPLSRIAEKLGASIYGGFKDEKDFHIVLPTYKDFVVGDYGYKYGLGKGIFCFGEYKWENSDLDDYVENNEEDKPVFYGFHWLGTLGGDLGRLPNFKVEGNIFKDYAETGKIKDDLTIFTI